MTPLILEALLVGGIAATLCLSAADFGMLNLAAGGWVLLGGWVGALVGGAVLGIDVPASPAGAVAIGAGALVLQIGSPLALRHQLRLDPLRYLFVALGISFILSSFLPSRVLDAFASTIPVQPTSTVQCLLVGASVAFVLGCVTTTTRTRSWSRTVLAFRALPDAVHADNQQQRPYRALCAVLGLEIGLLMILGACSAGVHNGLIGAAEQLTIVPVLAVMAVGGRPLYAFVLAGGIVLLGHLLVLRLPVPLSSYADPLKLCTLLVAVVWISLRDIPLVQARIIPRVPTPPSRWWHEPGVGGVLSISTVVILTAYLFARSPELSHRAGLVLSLAIAAWLSIRYLGVISVAWPAMGVTVAYAWATARASDASVLPVAVTLVVTGLWIGYVFLLRRLPVERALVADLALIVIIHDTLRVASNVVGDHQVLEFGPSFLGVAPDVTAVTVQGAVAISLFILGSSLCRARSLRPLSLAVADFRLGWRNGLPAVATFTRLATPVVVLAIASTLLAFSTQSSMLRPSDAALSTGVPVLLFAGIINSGPYGMAIAGGAVLAVYGLLASRLAAFGEDLSGLTGVGFVLGTMVLSTWERWREHTRG